jgi:hypothetical protein
VFALFSAVNVIFVQRRGEGMMKWQDLSMGQKETSVVP